jgi:hypothetical protein
VTDTALEEREADLPEQREEAVVTALLSGRTVRSVRKEFNLTLDEIDAIIARTWPVDNRARVRMIMMDLGLLDRLIAEFYQRALGSHDATSAAFATVAIKAMERKHDLTGMSAATRIDLTVTSQPQEAPSSFEKIHEMIMRIGRQKDDNGQPRDADQQPGDGNGQAGM